MLEVKPTGPSEVVEYHFIAIVVSGCRVTHVHCFDVAVCFEQYTLPHLLN